MTLASVTISLVEEAQGGPFVYWRDLAASCRAAKLVGFDAVEIFAPSPRDFDRATLRSLLDETGLAAAAFGTGAGWLRHHLTLTGNDAAERRRAQSFIGEVIELAAEFDAAAIIGSMQGRSSAQVSRERASGYLAEGLASLAEHASKFGQKLLYEPLNRYETNLFNTLSDAAGFVRSTGATNLQLLADLFHMNIEEVDLADAIRKNGPLIGHVHFVDSNRRAAGYGHLDFRPVAQALAEIGYNGFLSAEALALPDSDAAARQTIAAFRRHFPR